MVRTPDAPIPAIGTRLPLWLKRPSPALRYGGAVLLAALAQAVRLPLHPPTLMPYITYVPFILLTAAFGGLEPGLLCTVLCFFESIYFATEPIGSFRVADPRSWLGIGALALTGMAASVLFERLKRSGDRQRAAYLELATVQGSAPVMLLVVDDALRVRKANDLAVQFAGRNVSDILGLGLGGAIGCLNALADPGGCGHGPACTECAIRRAVSDSLRSGTPHSGVEAWCLCPWMAANKRDACRFPPSRCISTRPARARWFACKISPNISRRMRNCANIAIRCSGKPG